MASRGEPAPCGQLSDPTVLLKLVSILCQTHVYAWAAMHAPCSQTWPNADVGVRSKQWTLALFADVHACTGSSE